MKIDFGTLAFGFKLKSGVGTSNWATSLGQGKDYKINDNPEMNEIIKGILYSAIPLSNVKAKIGKGGKFFRGDEPDSPIIMAGIFSNVFINEIKIENQNYILIITRDTSKSHKGRLRLKYGPSNTYENGNFVYSNEDFIKAAKEKLGISDNACWFVYDITIRNQDELILNAVIVDKEKEIEYEDSLQLHSIWNDLIPTNYNIDNIVCNNLDYNIQSIYFGAPGTGKSYRVEKLIKECYPNIENKENPFVFKTTIYSDYSYYNFIGNIMPISKEGEIGYAFKAGIFSQALAMAFKYPQKEIFLIIEEMSRGDVASIFGDIFQLLDRDENGYSEYSINNDLISHYFYDENIDIGNKIFLPRNFHIIGTVNTSDQNVNVIDTAFKRRFEFVFVNVSPIETDSKTFVNSFVFKLASKEFEWNKLYITLNELITIKLKLNEDKQIGQFFIKFNNYKSDDHKFAAIQNKLLHYLWEDVQRAAISDDYSIFKEKYKTFSSLYKDFSEHINVFSDEFNTLYDKQIL